MASFVSFRVEYFRTFIAIYFRCGSWRKASLFFDYSWCLKIRDNIRKLLFTTIQDLLEHSRGQLGFDNFGLSLIQTLKDQGIGFLHIILYFLWLFMLWIVLELDLCPLRHLIFISGSFCEDLTIFLIFCH